MSDIMLAAEVADYLRLSERHIHNLVKEGSIPCFRINSSLRFRRKDIEAFCEQRVKPIAALNVITRDPKIRAWLEENDPKALQQCEEALK